LDPGLTPDEMCEVSIEVLNRNAHFLDETRDYWVAQRISRGLAAVGDEGWEQKGATVIVECIPLPFKPRAPYYTEGVDVVVSPIRRTSPDALTPRAKTFNYLNLNLAGMAVDSKSPRAHAVLLDANGNLAEGLGSNLFLVADGACLTPREQYVLPGISRATVMELAQEAGLEVREMDLDFHDAYNADEMFITSTSLCIAPVRTFSGAVVGAGEVPGPITKTLMQAYTELVDFDFVAQYVRHVS
jgi:branched-chain amino acid aminotransferase